MIESMDDNEKGSKSRQKQSGTPVLDNFSKDLNKMAAEGKLDPVIGREMEIHRIAQILSRRKKNNPIIVGEPGSGKTAIVEGLANKIVQGDCPRNLRDKRLVLLDLTSIVAGTKYRGQFEERMKVIIEELSENPDIIVFIDEIHTIVGAGNASGSMDASNIFKPALARGEIQCIGATTLDEYRTNFEKDGALERRFQKVSIDSPSKEETLLILQQSKSRYEDFHKVLYTEEILEMCVNLADRYITDREFPDKAFDILDEVGARSQVEVKMPESIEVLKNKAAELKQQKLDVVKKQDYEQAAEIRDKEKKLLERLEKEKVKFEKEQAENKKPIDPELVLTVVASMTKIPVNKLSVDDKAALVGLEESLKQQVIGQEVSATLVPPAIATPKAASSKKGVRTIARRRVTTVDRSPSGRERHDEKITVYLSPDELFDLDQARLQLRGDLGLAVDRGRIVRESIAVIIADLEAKGDQSILARRLRGQ